MTKWLVRCKLIHSLAFFQWRDKYGKVLSLEQADKRTAELKEIFEGKIIFMREHLEKSIEFKKSLTNLDEKKASSMVQIEKLRKEKKIKSRSDS